AELGGELHFTFNQGGAVAAASAMYLLLSIVMGVVDRFLKPPLWLQTIIFVPATLGAVWLGTQVSTYLLLPAATWGVIIMAYCFLAALTPVWVLLQPRGYLGGFILYMALVAGVIGIFFGGFEVRQAVFKGFSVPGETGSLFPFLFVTIACGACSGFHGLVCSGTTSKQIAAEPHCKTVGFGAMLLEGFVALIALATVMIVSSGDAAGRSPGALYGEGLGRFLTVLLGEKHLSFAITFGAMAFSTFIFDTLDVSTRLGRYILVELFGAKTDSKPAAVIATALTAGVPLVFILLAGEGSWRTFWTLFGTSNQLLAALSLMGVSVWLKKQGKRYWYTFLPMLFVSAVTLTALVTITFAGFRSTATSALRVNAGVSAVLLVLAGTLLVFGVRELLAPDPKLAPSPSV
ncbi:MAG: carbon starvation CstA family protein, partial [Myxococcaceae bacterium]